MEQFLKQWCLSLKFLNAEPEKKEAFTGFCNTLQFNEAAVIANFPFICSAFAGYKWSSPDLTATFTRILTSFKQMKI